MVMNYRVIEDETYIPIPAESLIGGTTLTFPVFIREREVFIQFFERGSRFNGPEKALLGEKNLSEVFIMMSDAPAYELYRAVQRKGEGGETVSRDSISPGYAGQKEEYFPIDRSFMVEGLAISFSLFRLVDHAFVLLAGATPVSPLILSTELVSLPGAFFIKKDDLALYHELLNGLMAATVEPGSEAWSLRVSAIRENAKVIMSCLIDNPRSGERIKESKEIVGSLVDCVFRSNDAIANMLSLKTYDYYTYTHSVNVAVLSIGLGVALGLKRPEVETLGIGSLLHDIGKSLIPHKILNKQGRLDDSEFEIMKTHVTEGERILLDHQDIPAKALDTVLQHHEKLSGRGYPYGRSGNEIGLFGRVSAIADCYDALTTNRPYKTAFTPYKALSIITGEKGDYDPGLLRLFISMLGKIHLQ